jgi:hypothetical protein
MSKSQRTKYNADLNRCAVAALSHNSLYAAENARYASVLVSDWDRTIEAIYASAPAVRVGRQAQQCSATHGFAFDPVNGGYAQGFFDAVFAEEQRLLSRREAAGARKLDRSAAHLFVHCFGSFEQLLNRMRASKHAQLFQADAAGIARYEHAAATAVVQLEQQYHVKL